MCIDIRKLLTFEHTFSLVCLFIVVHVYWHTEIIDIRAHILLSVPLHCCTCVLAYGNYRHSSTHSPQCASSLSYMCIGIRKLSTFEHTFSLVCLFIVVHVYWHTEIIDIRAHILLSVPLHCRTCVLAYGNYRHSSTHSPQCASSLWYMCIGIRKLLTFEHTFSLVCLFIVADVHWHTEIIDIRAHILLSVPLHCGTCLIGIRKLSTFEHILLILLSVPLHCGTCVLAYGNYRHSSTHSPQCASSLWHMCIGIRKLSTFEHTFSLVCLFIVVHVYWHTEIIDIRAHILLSVPLHCGTCVLAYGNYRHSSTHSPQCASSFVCTSSSTHSPQCAYSLYWHTEIIDIRAHILLSVPLHCGTCVLAYRNYRHSSTHSPQCASSLWQMCIDIRKLSTFEHTFSLVCLFIVAHVYWHTEIIDIRAHILLSVPLHCRTCVLAYGNYRHSSTHSPQCASSLWHMCIGIRKLSTFEHTFSLVCLFIVAHVH